MLTPRSLLAAAALLPVVAFPAYAAGGFLASAMFDRLDANHDGVISTNEIQAARSRMFDRMDTNRDGVVTQGEIDAFRAKARQGAAKRLARLADRMQQMPSSADRMAALDTNHDGRISRQEFVNRSMPWFGELAKGGNSVTKAQFEAFVGGRD